MIVGKVNRRVEHDGGGLAAVEDGGDLAWPETGVDPGDDGPK